MIKDQIIQNIKSALIKIGAADQPIDLDIPVNPDFGDYSSSIALKLTKTLKKNPLQIAQELVNNLSKNELIEKTEIAAPGFINFWLSQKQLLPNLINYSEGKFDFKDFHFGENHKIMVEFAHPNTHKLFHIGHLRNISIGESITRILEVSNNEVVRSNYQGDVGLHIAKCLWYIKNNLDELNEVKKNNLIAKIDFLAKAYSKGQIAYDENEKNKQEIIEINRMIYEQNGEIIPLLTETRQWSIEYFENIYKRLYSHFHRCYFESEFLRRALELCQQAKDQGILKMSEKALIFDGKPYKLDTRVFINSLGFLTYEGKELALAEKEFSDFGELDKNIHVVTPEQKSFFKATFKVEQLLDPKKYQDKQYHLAYEWVKFKEGKMSSRTGNIVTAEQLIDQAKGEIIKLFKCNEQIAEIIAVASVKYSFLKSDVYSQICFDINESISIEGNSGPYLLYTFVRTNSVIVKNQSLALTSNLQLDSITPEERSLITTLIQFPDIVYKSASNLAPNLIANYLFDLAQKYNLFYQKCQILSVEDNLRNQRILLTKCTNQILKKGLDLLGIKTVEKM